MSTKRQALIIQEERYRTLIDKRTEAIQLLDENGRILFSGGSVKRVLGYTAAELDGASPLEFVHPDDLPAFLKQVGRLIKKPGRQLRLEYRVKHKNGHWVWLEAVGVNQLNDPDIHAVVGDFRDITKRKEMEQALAESEARFRFMAESMPQKIFTATPDGKIDYFNPQWIEYTGLPMEHIQRDTFTSFSHPDDLNKTIESWMKTVKTGAPYRFEHRFKRHDGTFRWHLTRAQAMRDKKGKIIMWIGSSTDIEAVKQAQKREQRLEQRAAFLADQRKQLMELNKAKDEFISLASHQLRTPATGVKQYLAMIIEGFTDVEAPEEILNMVKVAYESNERQLKIVNDLLKVAYIDAGKLKIEKVPFDIMGLIDEVISDYGNVFRVRSQTLTHNKLCPEQVIDIDPHLIRMVLENIIDNASKYSPEGKTVTISERCTKKYMCIVISDEGVGIKPEEQVNLFKKFSRIDNPLSTLVGGTGLGLYWAKQVIELHGGSIKVKSEVDKGTTFTIKIPFAAKSVV